MLQTMCRNRKKLIRIVRLKIGSTTGSILGPILFVIHVNDINNCDNTVSFTKFADFFFNFMKGQLYKDVLQKT